MMPIEIQHADDPRVRAFCNLRDRDARDRAGLFIAESTRVVRRLLQYWPETVRQVLVDRKRWPGLQDAFASVNEPIPRISGSIAKEDDPTRLSGIEVYIADAEIVEAIAGFAVTRGAVAACTRPEPSRFAPRAVLGPLSTRSRLTLIALEEVADLDNVGSIVRHAAGFGVDAVLLSPTCGDPLYRKSIRTSMGHVFSVPWTMSHEPWPAGLDEALAVLNSEAGAITSEDDPDSVDCAGREPSAANRIERIGVELTDEAKPVWSTEFASRSVFVFGSEMKGLSRRTLARCDRLVQIPMRSDVPSLNVATAAAIVLYERNRQLWLSDQPAPAPSSPNASPQ